MVGITNSGETRFLKCRKLIKRLIERFTMPLRFRKIIKIAPGVKMNLSKGGVSFTIGKKGYHINIGKEGVKQTIGIPGTGISYQTYAGKDEDDVKEKNGKGDDDNMLGGLGGMAGMAAMAAAMNDNDDDNGDNDNESKSRSRKSNKKSESATPVKRKRATKKTRENHDSTPTALRSTFILISVLVFFVVGAAVLGLIPVDFLSNFGHTMVRWAMQFGR